MTSAVFFLAAAAQCIVGDAVDLAGAEGHHAADVRRLRVGEALRLTDGRGGAVDGQVSEVRRGSLSVVVSAVHVESPPAPRLVVAQALAKGGRDEDAIEAMTEIGVDEVIGWQASRSVAQWTDRTSDKWASTVAAAAKQSRRVWWPAVTGRMTTDALAERSEAETLALVLHESASTPLASLDLSTANSVLVAVGPEGGISNEELATLAGAGAVPVRLGESVLRSSTAGVAALAVICAATRWRA